MKLLSLLLLTLSFMARPMAAETLAGAPEVVSSASLQTLLDRGVARALADFQTKGLTTNQIAATLIEWKDGHQGAFAHYRGDVAIYPASVIKLFYLVAAHQWMEDGRLNDTAELRRALRDMIVESYNEATHYVLDVLTGTTSGPELTDDALRAWVDQRNAVNRYFTTRGYTNINANKKPWCEGPYGRETQAIQKFRPNRNQLTTDATARLLWEIATDRAVSPERCAQMRELLRRDVYGPVKDPEDQTHGFTGIALLEPRREGVILWSKAGWTSDTRHDAAILKLPNGRNLILVVFTTDHANERQIIPTVARVVLEELAK